MNHNTIHTVATGVTAGLAGGIVVIAAVVLWEERDWWDDAKKAIARRRLTPAERATLDRLRRDADRDRDRKQQERDDQKAEVRGKYKPWLLPPEHRVHGYTLAELPTAVLIEQIDRLGRPVPGIFWDQRAALLDEFDRRNSWDIKRTLPEVDQLRIKAAADHIEEIRYLPPARSATAPMFPTPDAEHLYGPRSDTDSADLIDGEA